MDDLSHVHKTPPSATKPMGAFALVCIIRKVFSCDKMFSSVERSALLRPGRPLVRIQSGAPQKDRCVFTQRSFLYGFWFVTHYATNQNHIRQLKSVSKLFCTVALFGTDYLYPKAYSDFCYQKSIQAILSGILLKMDGWMV